jgi:ParG
MAKKTAPFPSKPIRPTTGDEWVNDRTPATKVVSPPPVKPAKPKRLTLDLTDDLHRRIKVACSVRGTTMVVEITKLLIRWQQEIPFVRLLAAGRDHDRWIEKMHGLIAKNVHPILF